MNNALRIFLPVQTQSTNEIRLEMWEEGFECLSNQFHKWIIESMLSALFFLETNIACIESTR